MQIGLIVGNAIATIKHPSLEGRKLMVVQPLAADGTSPDGDPLIAVDTVGAGRHEHVVISSDGRSARELLGRDDSPVRWTIIGIRDS